MDKTNQSEVNVKFNTIFQLNCNVESYPPAMIHWEVDGGQVSNNTVVLVDTSPHGEIITYTCVAVNVINGVNHSANNSINVIIQGKMICVVYPIATVSIGIYYGMNSCATYRLET